MNQDKKDLMLVSLKNIFFNSGYANYPKCLSDDFVLVPNDVGIDQLRNDYEKMVECNYPNDITINFDQIMKSVLAPVKTDS